MRIECILKYPLWVLFFIYSTLIFGQVDFSWDNDLKFRNYTILEGLPSTSITSIVQDKQGFMWFGTRDGLSRFDGFDFENFYKNPADSTSLSHNQVQTVFVDRSDRLWVGTKNGLNMYSREKGFIRFYSGTSPHTLSSNSIHTITEDDQGYIWIGTAHGLNRLDPKDGTFTRHLQNSKHPDRTGSNYIKKVYFSSKNELWIITDQGVSQFDSNTSVFTHFDLGISNSELRQANFASAITESSDGRLWVGDTMGLWYFDQNTQHFERYQGHNNSLTAISVRSIIEDKKGHLLVGAYSGLYSINLRDNSVKTIQHDDADAHSLSANSIHSIYKDNSNNIWLGTWSGGVSYLDKNFDKFRHYSKISGLSYPVVSAFVEDKNHNLWIGTEGGGLNYFDRKTGKFTVFKNDSNSKNSLSTNNVHDIVLDKKGNLIVATFGGGLNYLDLSQDPLRFTQFTVDPTKKGSIRTNYILTIMNDSRDRVWVGTSNDGLSLFDKDNGVFTQIDDEINKKSQILSLFENEEGKIITGGANGLAEVNLITKKLDYSKFSTFNSRIKEHVLAIYQNKNGDYWLATEGEGLIFMTGDYTKITSYQKIDGLPNDVVYGILPDNSGNLWLSTHSGLSRFNPVTRSFENHTVHDGLQSNEFNFDAYAKTEAGELIFGGINGFNVFYPSHIKTHTPVAPVQLTDFKINEKTVRVGKSDSPLHKPIQETEIIELESNQSLFSFDFISLNYAQPGTIEYAYKLEGFSEAWLDIGQRRQITFTNLEPGTYTLHIKASNGEQDWNQSVASVQIKILPPFWKTWWAYLGYMVLALVVAFTIWTYIKLRLQDINALKEERLNREKDEELHEMKLQFFTNISHEFRTPLTLILGPIERLRHNKKNISPVVQNELGTIERNAKSLLRHVNNLLDFRKDETGKLTLKAANGNFIKFTRETCLSFQHVAEEKSIDYQVHTESDVLKLCFDRDKMEIVLYNLLSNAFKFTPNGGRVKVSIETEEESANTEKKSYVKVKVQNSGSGITSQHIQKIFDRFYQVDSIHTASQASSGIGLALSKRLVEMHHGRIVATSVLDESTTITFRIPMGTSHLKTEELHESFKHGEDVSNYKTEEITEAESWNVLELKKPKVAKENLPVILVVEDNREVRKFITSCFENEYQVCEAENGSLGYDKAVEVMPDLIISDVMMPEMDGITMCSKLKKETKTSHIPVILLTARTSLIFKKSGLETGANDYINKPFTPSILKLKVKNMLETKKRMQQYFVRNEKVNPEEIVLTSRDEEFLNKAIQCVEKHLSNSDFNVGVFVEEIGMSRSVVFRKIKGLTGQSTTEFIRTIRIKRAAQILVQNKLSISETAYEVGFNDLKYFRTCFRKQFHCAPSEYIAQHLPKEVPSLSDIE